MYSEAEMTCMCCGGRTSALCALVGQAVGTLAGDTMFLMLESAGLITLSGQCRVVHWLG